MRTRIVPAAIAVTFASALLLSAPVWAVVECSSINLQSCEESCELHGGSCRDYNVSSCFCGSAHFTYLCSNTVRSDECVCSDPYCEPPPPPGGCFLAGTVITMFDGSAKPIEKIRMGDVVLAFDEQSGEMRADTVKEVHEPIEADRYLVVNDALRLTPSHPVLSGGEWREIGELEVGDSVTDVNGNPVRIVSIERVDERVTVYNFSVNPYETYVANGIIVHNKPKKVKDGSGH